MKISGGEKWKKHLAELARKSKIHAGVLEGATNSMTGEDVATYAAMNEFGTESIPSRPFMRNTLKQCGKEWTNGVKNLLKNGRTPEDALALAGRRMADDIQATIKSDMPPPNSKKWAEQKNKLEKMRSGSLRAGTLIDTGALFHSINWEYAND